VPDVNIRVTTLGGEDAQSFTFRSREEDGILDDWMAGRCVDGYPWQLNGRWDEQLTTRVIVPWSAVEAITVEPIR
jgi:hypothetical protein